MTTKQMRKHEQVTSGQVQEMTTWLRRLTPEQYQERRTWLRRVTDPKAALEPIYPFTDDRPVKDGWFRKVEREGASCDEQIDISRLELAPFLRDGENWIGGNEMLLRAADTEAFPGCGKWSQHHAEQLLARANELPEGMRQFVLIFPDTVLVNRDGSRRVPCLFWRGAEWQLSWSWIDSYFGRGYRFVRLCK